MKNVIVSILLLSLLLLASAAEKDAVGQNPKPKTSEKAADQKSDGRVPEGIWKPIAAVMSGASLPKPALQAITLKIDGDKYEVTVEGEKEPDRGTCTLHTNTTPKRMTIKSTAGPNRGQTFFAIYEMKDSQSLRVCYDLSGTDFPKEFKAPKGTQLYLVDYRRQKD